MSQEVMDQFSKNLAENIEAEVLDKYKIVDSKREPLEAEVFFWSGGWCAETRNID